MLKELDNDQLVALVEVFTGGDPVLVLGPGCNRIGVDDAPAGGEETPWTEVVRRMRVLGTALHDFPRDREFLKTFWRESLSHSARAQWDGDSTASRFYDIDQNEDPSTLDLFRIALAVPVLQAAHCAAVCVGGTAGAGSVAVRDWLRLVGAAPNAPAGHADHQEVSRPLLHAVPDPDDAPAPHDVPEQAYKAFETSVNRAQQAAGVLHKLHARARLATADLNLAKKVLDTDIPYPVPENIKRWLAVLKPRAVHAQLQALAASVDGETQALTGAVVEWLSSLLWHVMVIDARVPPSQTELAFYLNLADGTSPVVHDYVRPRPGDHRVEVNGSDVALQADVAKMLASEVERLYTTRYPAFEEVRWRLPREQFALTMAATLLQQWEPERQAAARKDVTTPPPSTHTRLAIAIVSDYGLMVEHALMEVLDPGMTFHVILPVWVQSGTEPPRIDWLFGTFIREDTYDASSVRNGQWQWLEDVEPSIPSHPTVSGPIVLKINGSPLHCAETGAQLTGPANKVGRPRREDNGQRAPRLSERIAPAVIFSEHGSLQAVSSLRALRPHKPAPGERRHLGWTLFSGAGLQWSLRGWLFFGDRFADWLPRARLHFHAEPLADNIDDSRQDSDVLARCAVDREFDWPERSLLSALGITQYRGDLATLIEYWHTGPEQHPFLARVRQTVAAHRNEALR